MRIHPFNGSIFPATLVASTCWLLFAATPAWSREPLVRAVDLEIGEFQNVTLADGASVKVGLLGVTPQHDTVNGAVRGASVEVEIDGRRLTLPCGNYHLPHKTDAVQIDCPVVKAYYANSGKNDHWGLDKDARLRLWPAGSPLIEPEDFTHPLKQRLFATATQMANEPTFVDGGEVVSRPVVYYHAPLDFGGTEGMDEVVSATAGLVVSSATEVLPGHDDSPIQSRGDVVYILDDRGWYYRYSHLHEIAPEIKIGERIVMGQRIGLLGKEGGSGGWSHLHFGISRRQPSGKWGTEDAYAYIWEAYLREHSPEVVAVARPHRVARTGETVRLDGSKSWASKEIRDHHWTFTDGSEAQGSVVEKVYATPGQYSEVLRVTDAAGNVSYDFGVVQVIDVDHPKDMPPTLHVAHAPSLGVRANDEVTFKARIFRTNSGREQWDFGDGSPTVFTKSFNGKLDSLAPDGYATLVHRYEKPGVYVITVRRENEYGHPAVAHTSVVVGP